MQQSMIQIQRKKDNLTAKFLVRPETSDVKAVLEVWKKNSYQRKSFQISSGECWIDLGSNIGAFSVYAGSKGGRVLAFEADEFNAHATQENMDLNAINGRVIRAAIMPDTYVGETVTFYVNSRPMALRRHSIYAPKKDFVEIQVPVVRWGQLPFADYDCVKMNIEGAELELLESATSFQGVRKLVLEYSWDKDPSIARFQAIIAKLKQHFAYVDYNKTLPPGPKWIHYPPNIFVYCLRET